MGNTCIPMVESFGYLAKLNQFAKFKNKIKLKQKKKTHKELKVIYYLDFSGGKNSVFFF